jgi:hypothetical protein
VCRPGAFFSYTVTEEEISLVVDENTVAAFPPDTLVLSPDHLRAIQVYEGAHAISASTTILCLIPATRTPCSGLSCGDDTHACVNTTRHGRQI